MLQPKIILLAFFDNEMNRRDLGKTNWAFPQFHSIASLLTPSGFAKFALTHEAFISVDRYLRPVSEWSPFRVRSVCFSPLESQLWNIENTSAWKHLDSLDPEISRMKLNEAHKIKNPTHCWNHELSTNICGYHVKYNWRQPNPWFLNWGMHCYLMNKCFTNYSILKGICHNSIYNYLSHHELFAVSMYMC